jgi:hypothetical protein
MTTRNLILGLCSAAMCFGQTVGPAVSAYTLKNGVTYVPSDETTWGYHWMRIDPPLTFTFDAGGSPHLGIDPSALPGSSGLPDFATILSNPTTLSIAAGKARFGTQVFTEGPATVTLTGGYGRVWIYIDITGAITVALDPLTGSAPITASCNGCVVVPLVVPNVSGVPNNAIPLHSWTASNGLWDVNGGFDYRAALSTQPVIVIGGFGVEMVQTGTQTTISLGVPPANMTFVLTDPPQTVYLLKCRQADIYKNGLLLAENGINYTVDATGLIATLVTPPSVGDVMKVTYRCSQ